MKPLFRIVDIDAFYGPIQALRSVSLSIDEGEIVAIIGANGAGKSTLLMSIFGNPRVAKGTLQFRGEDLTGIPTHEIAAKGIALVPEGRRIFPGMTVVDNLLTGATANGGAYRSEDMSRVFELFPQLQERRGQRAGTLSGGEQQMLAIGRGVMGRPNLLLLDEPSLGLAPIIIQRIFRTLKEIAASGVTIFLVEQNANQALRLADRGYVLVNGSIKMSGTGEELLNDPEVRKAYLAGR